MRYWNPAFRFRTIAITQSTIKIFLLRILKLKPWLELRQMLVLLFQYGRSGKLPQHVPSEYHWINCIKVPNIFAPAENSCASTYSPSKNFFSELVQVENVLKNENVLSGASTRLVRSKMLKLKITNVAATMILTPMRGKQVHIGVATYCMWPLWPYGTYRNDFGEYFFIL